MSRRPLEGVRVVDFTWVRAGPWATRWLAVLGADVVKVEWPDPVLGGSTGRLGDARGTPEGIPRSMNSSGGFNDGNAMKRSITLNTRTPRGMEVLKKLIAVSDIVIENFSTGTLDRWGLSYEELKRIREDIIYVSMAGWGHAGPRGNYTTTGPSVQALSGLTHLSGLPGRPPAGWGWSYMDDTGGMYGVISMLNALRHRAETGEGQHVDMSQVAAGMTLTGAALLDYTVNGRGTRREGFPAGNRSVWPGTPVVYNHRGAICAPHNAYRTKPVGYNDWAAIVCETDEEWQRLVRVMGSPAWAADSKYATLAGRLEHQEELDRQIEEWTKTLEKYELADLCQTGGVRALPVQSSEDRVEHDPQLRSREAYATADHPILGTWPMQQAPWKMHGTPTPVAFGAPLAGQHNIPILCGMLGVTKEELRAGYEDNTFWPKVVPVEPYLYEALDSEPIPQVSEERPPVAVTRVPGEERSPLTGLRVVEVADRTGQWCGKLLSDAGAEVIKVEPPGGAAERRVGPFYQDVEDPERSLHFWHYNTGKRSVTLDLETEEGRDALRRLVADADILLETMPPGWFASKGMGYESLSAENPPLVMCSLTPFGQDGPWRDYLSADMLHLAAGGQMAGCGYDPVDDEEQIPIAPGGGNAWHCGSHFAYIAILSAIMSRHATGVGQYIDTSVHGALALTTEGQVPTWIYGKQVLKRQTGRHAAWPLTPPSQLLMADGNYLQLTGSAMQVRALGPVIDWMDREGKAEDLRDPKYLDPKQFEENRAHVSAVVTNFVTSMGAEEAMVGGQELANVPWGAVRATEDTLKDQHWHARGFFVQVEHPELGQSFTYPGGASIYSASPLRIRKRAPLIGEDNQAILGG